MRIPLLLCLLTFVFLSFSAESSSCETYRVSSQQSSPLQGGTDYRSMAAQDAVNAGIPAQYFVAQINEESGFNPSAISPMGAVGISQIIPSTAQEWGVDPHDPVASLRVAAQHMAWYQSHYGDYARALACYNAGCSTLEWAMRNCQDYYWCLPRETRNYILAIMGKRP